MLAPVITFLSDYGLEDDFVAYYARTFADVGPDELLVYEDAGGMLALAVSHGSAQARLGLAVDDELALKRA